MLTPPSLASRDQRTLFVGGVVDGQWLSVPQDCDRYEVPRIAEIPLDGLEDIPARAVLSRELYRREHVCSPSGSLTFFVAAPLSGLAALEMLLRGYRPVSQEKDAC
jgi:hypothetical protein